MKKALIVLLIAVFGFTVSEAKAGDHRRRGGISDTAIVGSVVTLVAGLGISNVFTANKREETRQKAIDAQKEVAIAGINARTVSDAAHNLGGNGEAEYIDELTGKKVKIKVDVKNAFPGSTTVTPKKALGRQETSRRSCDRFQSPRQYQYCLQEGG